MPKCEAAIFQLEITASVVMFFARHRIMKLSRKSPSNNIEPTLRTEEMTPPSASYLLGLSSRLWAPIINVKAANQACAATF